MTGMNPNLLTNVSYTCDDCGGYVDVPAPDSPAEGDEREEA